MNKNVLSEIKICFSEMWVQSEGHTKGPRRIHAAVSCRLLTPGLEVIWQTAWGNSLSYHLYHRLIFSVWGNSLSFVPQIIKQTMCGNSFSSYNLYHRFIWHG